jgi:hypothetical protein
MDPESGSSSQPASAKAAGNDRRGSERYASGPDSPWQAVCEGDSGGSRAGVRDVSLTGLALVVRQPHRTGSVLVVRLQNRERRLARLLPIRVMHATQLPAGEWILGCQFVRKLTLPELQGLLGAGEIEAVSNQGVSSCGNQ